MIETTKKVSKDAQEIINQRISYLDKSFENLKILEERLKHEKFLDHKTLVHESQIWHEYFNELSIIYRLLHILYFYDIESNNSSKIDIVDNKLLDEIKKDTIRIAQNEAKKTAMDITKQSLIFEGELNTIQCKTCGKLNPHENNFCGNCGQELNP